jgi:chromosome partitioning protein
MLVVAVINPKGGVGKSTLSTNLAGYFAAQGHKVMLGDADLQHSSRAWLALRPANLPLISNWEMSDSQVVRPPKGTTHVVIDTPAGLKGSKLDAILKIADKVIVPLQASMFDILATEDFLRKLVKRDAKCEVAVLGMRVNSRTKSADQLDHYVSQLGFSNVGFLRDTQNYVQLAAHGATLWDVAASKVEKDIAQWEAVLKWVEQK